VYETQNKKLLKLKMGGGKYNDFDKSKEAHVFKDVNNDLQICKELNELKEECKQIAELKVKFEMMKNEICELKTQNIDLKNRISYLNNTHQKFEQLKSELLNVIQLHSVSDEEFMDFCDYGQTVQVQAALSSRKQPERQKLLKFKLDGLTALMHASSEGHKGAVKCLLEHQADVNAVNSIGRTSLMCASDTGHKEVVESLLEHQADVNAVDSDCCTALMHASGKGHNVFPEAQKMAGWKATSCFFFFACVFLVGEFCSGFLQPVQIKSAPENKIHVKYFDVGKRKHNMVMMSTVLEKPVTVIEKQTVQNTDSDSELRGKYTVLLFNDPMNYREYVARCLVEVVGMPESSAFDIMGEAHKNGMAVVGAWHQELAEAYKEALSARSLTVDIVDM